MNGYEKELGLFWYIVFDILVFLLHHNFVEIEIENKVENLELLDVCMCCVLCFGNGSVCCDCSVWGVVWCVLWLYVWFACDVVIWLILCCDMYVLIMYILWVIVWLYNLTWRKKKNISVIIQILGGDLVSIRCYFGVFHYHFNIISLWFHYHNIIISLSFQYHFIITALSFPYHFIHFSL